jgi:uroporphyrinogen decarboxylase
VRFPEELLTVDVDAVNAFCRNTDQFVIAGTCPRPFERLQFYRNSENLYTDLGEARPEMLAFLERLHEFYLKELEIWVKTDVDALTFMDDWGAQRALLISPVMWRRLFKPLYKDYIDVAHRHGKKIFMHSDGFIAPIIGDLVELGLDALNCQLFTMDIESLGRQFAGKITFWGEIDRQVLLPSGTPADIDRAVRRVKDALWRDGGAIAQCEFGPGGRPENVYQVYKTWEDVV